MERAAGRMGTFDKVYNYLAQELKVGEKKVNFRLPPIREISKKTGVSASSVRNVLVDLSKDGRVEIFPGSGAFWIPHLRQKKGELVIGMNSFVTPEHEEVAKKRSESLYGGMVREAMKEGMEIKFKPVAFDLANLDAIDFDSLRAGVSGMDCFFFSYPGPATKKLIAFFETCGVPCIFYNPMSPSDTVNFLSPDYYGAAQKIGRVWGRTGRERVLLLQAPSAEKSTSCQLIYAGVLTGLGLAGGTLPEIYRVNAPENTRTSGYATFREFLVSQGRAPDAVYCTADDLALGVLDVAQEFDIKIPSTMSVIGGNGIHRTDGHLPLLTTTEQPFGKIGEGFIRLFQKRSANHMGDVPGIYFPMRILTGQTTRPEENKLFASENW